MRLVEISRGWASVLPEPLYSDVRNYPRYDCTAAYRFGRFNRNIIRSADIARNYNKLLRFG